MTNTTRGDSDPLTFRYKLVDDLPLHVDIYPPSLPSYDTNHIATVASVIYFHAGGLVAGHRRQDWFPTWLKDRLSTSGVAFISADYRLLGRSTGHDILQDIKDVFALVSLDLNTKLDCILSSQHLPRFHISSDAIAVAGSSAGGICACLAAMHAVPRPTALLSLYGTGGDLLSDLFLQIKNEPFFDGAPLIDPGNFREYLFPQSNNLPLIAECPYGRTENPREYLTRLYLQIGEWLDYYTGDHQLSQHLRDNLSRDSIPSVHIPLFPQFGITPEMPPTCLVHGTADLSIPVQSSLHLQGVCEAAGVDVVLKLVEGKDHLFDVGPGTNDLFGGTDGLFDELAKFLLRRLEVNGERTAASISLKSRF